MIFREQSQLQLSIAPPKSTPCLHWMLTACITLDINPDGMENKGQHHDHKKPKKHFRNCVSYPQHSKAASCRNKVHVSHNKLEQLTTRDHSYKSAVKSVENY